MMCKKMIILTLCVVFLANLLTGCNQVSDIVDSIGQNSSNIYYFDDVLDFGDFYIYFTELVHSRSIRGYETVSDEDVMNGFNGLITSTCDDYIALNEITAVMTYINTDYDTQKYGVPFYSFSTTDDIEIQALASKERANIFFGGGVDKEYYAKSLELTYTSKAGKTYQYTIESDLSDFDAQFKSGASTSDDE
jgi:hypothetical protein